MDDQEIRDVLRRARAMTDDQPEPYRSLAFPIVFETLLKGASIPVAAASVRSASLTPIDMDLVEFLASKKITTHPDRVVAIAFFIYRTEDSAGVTTRELAEGYSKARVRKPQNFPDVIAACVRRGHLVEGPRKDGMKSWVITRTGETYTEQAL